LVEAMRTVLSRVHTSTRPNRPFTYY